MKERLFDSRGADRAQVHRAPFQDGADCGAIHAIGNGEILLYGRGPEWMQAFGAPYSCPTVLSLIVPKGDSVQCASHRRAGTNAWVHRMAAGEMVDCASREQHCIARHWTLNAPVQFDLDCHDFALDDQSALLSGAWLVSVPATAALYNDYPILQQTFMMVRLLGEYRAERIPIGLKITLSGEGTLLLTGARTYGDCVLQMRSAGALSFEALLEQSNREDRAFLESCARRRAPLKEHPLRNAVEEAIEDVALLVRAQQHRGGGVQAGHNYHLAYVRDQYGVSRGLLAMGAWEEAAAILRFYREIFARHGFVATAQAMGVDGIFHVHECDRTEITGYLLLQACDLLRVNRDSDFFLSLRPMMKWAIDAQLECLHNGMLPFNGDETYIAGRIVPRTILNHGAFEATLLLITGGRRYIGLCHAMGSFESWMTDVLAKLDEVSARFEANFRRGDHYVANSLKRMEGLIEPEFRHGVCYNEDFFGWLHREAESSYVCPKCAGGRDYRPFRQELLLNSTMLMAPFIQADQISPEFCAMQTARYLAEYREKGILPSLPDGDRCLGYDFGLMLFAAKDAGLDADDLLAHMLSLQDECGGWSEYYCGTAHQNTRCRPWESAINVAGAIRYLAQS